MNTFLAWLEKYDLLIQLVITIATISLSLMAVFQTKKISERQLEQEEKIAKQQAELQEKQISISIYEQKNEINKVLNSVFDIVDSLSLIVTSPRIDKLTQRSLYEVLNRLISDVDFKNIYYILDQSRFFFSSDLCIKIRFVKSSFMSIRIFTNCLDLLVNDEEVKDTSVAEICKACEDIKHYQSSIEESIINELKFM